MFKVNIDNTEPPMFTFRNTNREMRLCAITASSPILRQADVAGMHLENNLTLTE